MGLMNLYLKINKKLEEIKKFDETIEELWGFDFVSRGGSSNGNYYVPLSDIIENLFNA